MSVLRDKYNAIAASWKNGAPKVAAWMNEATTEIDDLRARVAALEHVPVPPPVPGAQRWGFCLAPGPNDDYSTAAFKPQFEGFAALMADRIDRALPRITGHEFAASQAMSYGYPHWTVTLGIRPQPTDTFVNYVVDYAKKFPAAIIEFGNELNLNPGGQGSYTPKQFADLHLYCYPRIRAQVPNPIMLSGIGNSTSDGGLDPLPYCKQLRDLGCVAGKGFDADQGGFHLYHPNDPAAADRWMHIVTPDAAGDSCVKVLGITGWYMTEFGSAMFRHDGTRLMTLDQQAQCATAWTNWLKKAPGCRGGMWYAYSDYADGVGAGYGLAEKDWTRRPAWAAYQAGTA